MENIAMLQLSNGALYEVGTAADFIRHETETILPRGTWKTSKHMAKGCFAMQVVDFSDSNFWRGFFIAFNLEWETILKTRWSKYKLFSNIFAKLEATDTMETLFQTKHMGMVAFCGRWVRCPQFLMRPEV